MRNSILIAIGLFSSIVVLAQKQELDAYIENIVEEVAAANDDDVDLDAVLSDLEFFYSNPLNLNAATDGELGKLMVLSDFQIASVLDYRKSVHRILTVNELRYVYGFNNRVVDLIAPFVYCGTANLKKPQSFQHLIKRSQHEILISSSYNSRVLNSNYKGTPIQQYTRYIGRFSDKVKLGLIADKDAGEEFFSGTNNYGFDFYSGFLKYSSNTILKSVVLGDYRVRLGQGLLVWNGFSSGKSSEISTIKKRGQGVSENTSKDEFNYFRGAAASFSKKGFSLDVWSSKKKLDGVTDSINGVAELRSINSTGYHRTETEINRKGNIGELTYGASIGYGSMHFNMSFNWLHTEYSQEIIPSDATYKMKDFTGSGYDGASVGYNMLFQKAQVYGELAYGNDGMAMITGINMLPTTDFTATLFYRYYEPEFFSPYSNGIVESGNTNNEEGFFGGVNWQTDWNIRFSAYADLFSFPWLINSSDLPSNGADYFVQANYKTYSGLNFIVRYKYKEKEKNYKVDGNKTNAQETSYKQSFRVHAGYEISDKLRLASRFEWSESGLSPKESYKGYLIYQDIITRPFHNTSVYFRYAQFQVEDYNSRIYAYENDALYSYSMPAYYGEGQKFYVMIRQKFGRGVSVWLRYAHTGYFNEDYELKNEIRAQLMLKF